MDGNNLYNEFPLALTFYAYTGTLHSSLDSGLAQLSSIVSGCLYLSFGQTLSLTNAVS
ncbi:MAG: hypothetical protein PHN71_08245 [Candidatus Cloacimonetes bacterium]|nr:hypothetical protein [Candidatus Cloacimonadota bacterium]